MKNNKGFTLVELLAVIAILAILMIVAMPSVIKVFNEAKQDSFELEVGNVIKEVQKEFVSDTMFSNGSSSIVYKNTDTTEGNNNNNTLDMDGEKLEYSITVNSEGNITCMSIKNDEYYYHYSGSGLKTTDEINSEDLEGSTWKECTISSTGDSDDEIPESTTSNTCFKYSNIGGSIQIDHYYFYENNDTSNNPCSMYVVIPSTIDGLPVTAIGEYAFTNDDDEIQQLKSNNDEYEIKKLGREGTSGGMGITSVSFPNTITIIKKLAFAKNKLTSVNLPTSLTTIEYAAFEQNEITSFTANSNLTSIGAYAFFQNQIESILLGNVSEIYSYAFSENIISSLIIPNSVTTLGEKAFFKNRISNLTIGSGLTKISTGVFYANKLTNVTIPSGITEIEKDAFRSNEINTVIISSSVTTIGDYAFYENKITSLTLNEGLKIIGYEAFGNKTTNTTNTTDITDKINKINTIIIPSSVTTIGNYAFYENETTSLTLNEGLEKIGDNAFYGNKLKNIEIPSTITYIGTETFKSSLGDNEEISITNKTCNGKPWYNILSNTKNLTSISTGTYTINNIVYTITNGSNCQ